MIANKDKRGFEMSFAWIFAMIVGAAILFIAIYFAVTLITSEEKEVTTETAKSIIGTFDVLLTSKDRLKINNVDLAKDTRVYTYCRTGGDFGESRIAISETSSFGEEWTAIGGGVSTNNQYIFTDEVIEGNKLYFIVMPFEMPFKTADIMIVHAQPYCFVKAPEEIEEEVDNMLVDKVKNVEIVKTINNCSKSSVKVCFENERGCNVTVVGKCSSGIYCESLYDLGSVYKNGEKLDYVTKDLMYAGIFSEKEVYECNVKRFMMRLDKVGEIYIRKLNYLGSGCSSDVQKGISDLKVKAQNYEDMGDLISIKDTADRISEANKGCGGVY